MKEGGDLEGREMGRGQGCLPSQRTHGRRPGSCHGNKFTLKNGDHGDGGGNEDDDNDYASVDDGDANADEDGGDDDDDKG